MIKVDKGAYVTLTLRMRVDQSDVDGYSNVEDFVNSTELRDFEVIDQDWYHMKTVEDEELEEIEEV